MSAKIIYLEDYRQINCQRCGKSVERSRRVYAIPTCFACLPPPEPLPIVLPRHDKDKDKDNA
jgi:hypothetical protein